jgi:hypothetical protein
MDLYSPYSRKEGHEIRDILLARFLRLFWSILCCRRVVLFCSYSRLCARFSRCCFIGGSYSSTDLLARFSRQKGGTVVGVCKLSLATMYDCCSF